ncbi:MAG: DNA topoisomerase [Solibacillus sp.]
MRVIIAEKPSVAKNIADALKIKTKRDGYFEGQDYIITWAFGHLMQLFDAKDYDAKMKKWSMDNFPFFPPTFQYKVKSDPRKREKEDAGARKQLRIINSLLKRKDVNMIISACDFDREGQIIGDTIIYNLKPKCDVYRLLLNEWTPDEVLRGLAEIRPNSAMKPLQDAGISRQWADWILGINLTSVATLKYQKGSGKALNIGRVIMPTLKIIYDRDKEINNFVPEQYFKLTGTFATHAGETYEGAYMLAAKDKFKTKEELAPIEEAMRGQNAAVVDKKVEQKKEYPPFLFNLSNLQGYITSKYKGWTSDKVLKVAQNLYERKYITYPRTGSVVLEESLVEKAAKVLASHKKGLPYEEELVFAKKKRVFDTAKVDGHSAIIPTYVKPKSLNDEDALVYNAIKNRFLMQFMPLAEYEETRLVTKVAHPQIPGLFHTKGKVQLVEGWKKVEEMESKDTILPNVAFGEQVAVKSAKLREHMTEPPKKHTEKTLLKVMETCGKKVDDEQGQDEELLSAVLQGYSIGTPATRAETIKKLKDVGYITSEGKNLVTTELGRNLVETFPVRELFDLEFTGKLEKTLNDIEKQRVSKQSFLHVIFEFTANAVQKIKLEEDKILKEVTSKKQSYEQVGKCPLCAHAVIEGDKGFGCSNWKSGCKFVIWKNDKYLAAMKKKPTKTMVKQLLKDGSVLVKGMTSKTGNTFDAVLRYEKNVDNAYFGWKMEFPNR